MSIFNSASDYKRMRAEIERMARERVEGYFPMPSSDPFSSPMPPRPSTPDASAVKQWLHETRTDVTWDAIIGNNEAKRALRHTAILRSPIPSASTRNQCVISRHPLQRVARICRYSRQSR